MRRTNFLLALVVLACATSACNNESEQEKLARRLNEEHDKQKEKQAKAMEKVRARDAEREKNPPPPPPWEK